ncbi:MAG: hypothetical protein OEZ29_04025 [Candidatus Bathyarchaeota archaeon]|nr:hypothetical protein [Candidatus Bathyarchaeota archaeon]
MNRKKHKLHLVSPSGEEYELGFLSPCRDGFVLGTPRVEEVDTSHLTTIFKKGILSAHITPQEHPQDKRYFPPMSKEEIAEKTQALVEGNVISQLTPNQLSENVLYMTQKFIDWFESLKNALYEKKISPKEVIHILKFKRLLRNLPQLIEEFQKSPHSFLGLCEAREILEDSSKIYGLNNSGLFIVPLENQLYGVRFSLFTNFNFVPTLEEQEISTPLDEIYRSIGVSEYIEEVQRKRFFEKLLSKDRHGE